MQHKALQSEALEARSMQIVDRFAATVHAFMDLIMAFLGLHISLSHSCDISLLQKPREASALSQMKNFPY